MRKAGKRNQKGQVFIEVLCGMFILIPIALAALDMMVLVLGNSANDSLAKNCARAAANEQSADKAKQAAMQVINEFPASPLVEKVVLDQSKMTYDAKEEVTVETIITVRIPVVFPAMPSTMDFRARATEPVVGVSAAPDQTLSPF
ncbi:MAG: hypothetical protein SGJ27_15470 [Candidatus Melainabacteria bacterium]|nr:hypothetical protein [Candidatus Melainabacteria bacterium]